MVHCSTPIVNRVPCGALVRREGPLLRSVLVPIDRSEATSFSTQIADDLRQRIAEGEFAADHRLPSLRALAAEYEVAELTAHAAVRLLKAEGLLVAAPGRGTFVRRPAEPQDGAAPPDELGALRREVAELRLRIDRLEHRSDDGGAGDTSSVMTP
ncbi:MAG: GntR family transcriptional regulator [Pseudonocardiaceae bacterium]|nr:GntR family transcriptional regulator [Pseudonocardiaceae bacterium]